MHRILNRSFLASALCAVSFALCPQFASATDSPADAQFVQGNNAADAKQYAEAIGHFDKAIQLDPNFWKAYANRSAARYNASDYNGALADVKLALSHFPDNENLKNILSMCENQLNGNADLAARREAARQMLLNATLGGDIADPGFQILMQARRKVGLNPITGMPATGSNMMQNASQNKAFADTAPAKNASAAATVAHHSPFSTAAAEPSNALQDSLAMQVSNLPPPNFDNASRASTAPTGSSPFSEPAPVPSTSGVNLMTSTGGGLVNTIPGQSQGTSLVAPLPNRSENRAPRQNPANAPRLSADNDARDPKTNMTAQDYFDRACGKDKAQDFQGALKDYDEAIKLNPNHGPAYCNRGSTRFNSGNRKGALEDFNMAVQLMPNHEGVKQLRDRVAAMMGQ